MTDLTQQKLILQAAQQSFAQISKLSLFNYM
jgi:flagellin-like hook-associated protein FlgL